MMKLGSLFSDGAVLQRNQPISVWGETLPDVLIKAEMAGREGFAKSSASGEFQLQLPPSAGHGPYPWQGSRKRLFPLWQLNCGFYHFVVKLYILSAFSRLMPQLTFLWLIP